MKKTLLLYLQSKNIILFNSSLLLIFLSFSKPMIRCDICPIIYIHPSYAIELYHKYIHNHTNYEVCDNYNYYHLNCPSLRIYPR